MKIYIDNKDKIVNALLYCNKTTKTEIYNTFQDIENGDYNDILDATEYGFMALDAITREYFDEDGIRYILKLNIKEVN